MANILQAIETLDYGGAEVVVVNLIERLSPHHKVTLCCVKKTGPLVERVPTGTEVICLHKPEGNDLLTSSRIARIIKQYEIDLVHTHNWDVLRDVALGSIFFGRSPLVHTVHGPFLRHAPNFLGKKKNVLRRWIEKISAMYASRLICVSCYLREEVLHELKIRPGKVSMIWNGVAPRSRDVLDRRLACRTQKKIKLITVGRLCKIKNYSMLLKAFSIALAQSKFPMSLFFVGDGPERDHLKTLSMNLGIADSVKFLGFREDVQELLDQCDIFVLSSHYEGISIAILEAMRVGLPIIATAVGGNVELVKHGNSGLLCKDNNCSDFAKQIVFLCENEQVRLQMGRKAYDRVISCFNIERATQSYLKIYDQVIKEKHKTRRK